MSRTPENDRGLREQVLAWADDQMQALPERRTAGAHSKAEVLTDLRNFLARVTSPAMTAEVD